MKPKNFDSLASTRLTWSQINEFFEGEWVELVDYKWDWNQTLQSWGHVRNHAKDRNELISKIRESDKTSNSVVLYLGAARSTFEHSVSAAV